MKWFIVTDTHFFHEKIKGYENRPENFEELIIKRWQNTVSENDIVIHLGDVIFRQSSKLGDILASLPGKKILTRGNHDHHRTAWYMNKGFSFVCKAFQYKEVIFSHQPVETSKINVHGHFHRHGDRYLPEYPWYSTKNHIAVSIEENDYFPVLLDQILFDRGFSI